MKEANKQFPETIYLFDYDDGTVWCDEPTPEHGMDSNDAAKYIRADKANEALQSQVDELMATVNALRECWQKGWFCAGDENQLKFDSLMLELCENPKFFCNRLSSRDERVRNEAIDECALIVEPQSGLAAQRIRELKKVITNE